jgi:hypothetical protein
MKRLLKNYLFLNKYKFCGLNRQWLSLAILFYVFSCSGQVIKYANYVNNSSFEQLTISPNSNPWDRAKYWGPMDSAGGAAYVTRAKMFGTTPNSGTGYQMPRTGDNYVLTQFYCDLSTCSYTNSRGYPRNRLKRNLKGGVTYCVKYHTVNTNNCVVGIDSYGAFFGGSWLDTTKKCSMPITYISPQISWQGGIIIDTMNWVPITGTFVADGTEKYMVLGNFKSNPATQTTIINPTYLPNLSNDIYIDDVSLIEMDLPAFAGRDTSVIPGDSIYLGYEQDIEINESCIWYKWPNMTTPIDTIAGFWLKPVSNGTFVVRQQLWCSGVKWDTVVIEMNPLGLNEKLNPDSYRDINEELKIYPVPASNFFEVSIQNQYLVHDFKQLRIYNSLGEMIREEEINFENGKAVLKVDNLSNGAYIVEINNSRNERITKKLLISK